MTARVLPLLLLIGLGFDGGEMTAPVPFRFAVIVSRQNGTTDISIADIRRIYFGSITRWPDGTRIVPVMFDPDSAEGRLFLKRIVQMSDVDYAQLWIGQVFRGQSSALPYVVRADEEARRYVATHPAAIALVAAGAADTSVKVLTVEGKAPATAGYALAW